MLASWTGCVALSSTAADFWIPTDDAKMHMPMVESQVVAIAAGDTQAVLIKQGGTVVNWGTNDQGQLNLPAGLVDAVAIASASNHSLALRRDGTVVAWGFDEYGDCDVPAGLSHVVAISTSYKRNVALKSDGTVVAWGFNQSGYNTVPGDARGLIGVATGIFHTLGLKADGTVIAWGDSLYGQSRVPSGLTGVVAVAASGFHSLALKSDGTVVAWGDNTAGQNDVPAGLNGVVSIAAGAYFTLALKSDGTVVAWGNNNSGQTSVPAGLSGVTAIAAGASVAVALKSDGTVVTWGRGSYAESLVPPDIRSWQSLAFSAIRVLVQRTDGTVFPWNGNPANVPAGLSGVTQVAVGYSDYPSVALKNDGTVVEWESPGTPEWLVPAGLAGVSSIAASDVSVLAGKSDGSVVEWGPGAGPAPMVRYGDGSVRSWVGGNSDTTPTGLSPTIAISAGSPQFLSLQNDGTVAEWGGNFSGLPSGLSGVVAISAGGYHKVALKNDGTTVTWETTKSSEQVPAALQGSISAIASGIYQTWVKAPRVGVSVTIPAQTHAFTGQPIQATVNTEPGFFIDSVTYDGSLMPPTVPGDYTVRAVVDRWGYHGEATASMSITKATQVISGLPVFGTHTYGDPDISLAGVSGGASGNPVTFTSSDPSVASISGSAVTILHAGVTTITAQQAGSATFQAATPVAQILTVAPAMLLVTGNDVTRPQGQTNPLFLATVSGFLRGDPPSVVTGTPTLSTTANSSSPPGTYPIVVDASGMSAADYRFQAVSGTLTIASPAGSAGDSGGGGHRCGFGASFAGLLALIGWIMRLRLERRER
jgi:alpha-tubulin suppressor-like RCC1 family protein